MALDLEPKIRPFVEYMIDKAKLEFYQDLQIDQMECGSLSYKGNDRFVVHVPFGNVDPLECLIVMNASELEDFDASILNNTEFMNKMLTLNELPLNNWNPKDTRSLWSVIKDLQKELRIFTHENIEDLGSPSFRRMSELFRSSEGRCTVF